MIKRRFLLLLVAVAPCCLSGAWAQVPARRPTVGVLGTGAPVSCASGALGYGSACMVEGMQSLGYVDGRNVAYEYR